MFKKLKQGHNILIMESFYNIRANRSNGIHVKDPSDLMIDMEAQKAANPLRLKIIQSD
jgi:hypothetical protein